ncbi:Exo 5'-3' exonuclease (including N-terminal domain of PolI) [uncultured Caudovirales phage]|uniref:Exo 5'-3' exonuclease (Including N-terminal domain of PolI) n=1 Tax=uncultured Caudovirales phage TaxID=2100421 RepID=A0A6J5LVT6_9CAUD|nr:Exo 5'-3' exonuclease (including N-terminal domain of PolI) [uncultured Caudovirales phage]
MRYVLIDTANMFFRARHGAFRASDTWEKIGFALHVTLMSANKVAQRFKADHVVFALEGRSWRKDHYEPYKKNRAVARAALTEAEQEEDKMFWETYDALTKYLAERTNCSVIQCPTAEGDDIIARWIALHPQDEHIIISSDTDFVQLIAPNVTQYNGISDEHITLEGYFDAKGKPVIDKKKQEPKTIPDPAWLLFEKCMRGDSSDNVFSAFPGVRTKGTKNKVGLQEAFEDRERQGFNWNNMMLQRWTDHNGQEHRVLDDYNRNVSLIDLTAQPQAIKDVVDACIREQISHKDVGQVGVRFMQFCGKYDLIKCSESADSFGKWLNETYKGVLNDHS